MHKGSGYCKATWHSLKEKLGHVSGEEEEERKNRRSDFVAMEIGITLWHFGTGTCGWLSACQIFVYAMR